MFSSFLLNNNVSLDTWSRDFTCGLVWSFSDCVIWFNLSQHTTYNDIIVKGDNNVATFLVNYNPDAIYRSFMQFRADDQKMSGRVLFFGQFLSMVEGQNLLNKFCMCFKVACVLWMSWLKLN